MEKFDCINGLRILLYIHNSIFVDRDIRCDFNSPFYEENECAWRYSQKTMASLNLGTDFKRLVRVKVNNPAMQSMNYFTTSNTQFGKGDAFKFSLFVLRSRPI